MINNIGLVQASYTLIYTYGAAASLPVPVTLLGLAEIRRVGGVCGWGPEYNSGAIPVSILPDGEGE